MKNSTKFYKHIKSLLHRVQPIKICLFISTMTYTYTYTSKNITFPYKHNIKYNYKKNNNKMMLIN